MTAPSQPAAAAGGVVEHTPGPWDADGPLKPGPAWRIRNAWGLVCYVGDPVTASYDRANARLIAAAPDLLAACKRALNFYLNTQSSMGIEEGSADELEGTPILRAAIARATGAAP